MLGNTHMTWSKPAVFLDYDHLFFQLSVLFSLMLNCVCGFLAANHELGLLCFLIFFVVLDEELDEIEATEREVHFEAMWLLLELD